MPIFIELLDNHEEILRARTELQLAEAESKLTMLSPSPIFTFGNACGDISGISMPHQLYAGFDFTIETGGKKRSRTQYAQAQAANARVTYEIFVRNFHREALLLYNTCWAEEQHLAALQKCYRILSKLSAGDSIATIEKRIQLKKLSLEIASLAADYGAHLLAFNELIDQPTKCYPASAAWDDDITLPETLGEDDLLLSRQEASHTLSHHELALAESNQRGDLTFSIGNSFMTRARNPEAPSPRYNAITATLSIPVRFSSN